MSTVDVIIPTYKPDISLFSLIDDLEKQALAPDHIILMNTEERYWKELLDKAGKNPLEKYDNIILRHVDKRDFDHGNTRNQGVELSKAEFFLMMTQDAFPRDKMLISSLVKAFEDSDVAAAYGRQYPKSDCNLAERYARKFNYPNETIKKTQGDVDRLGIKTYFCSNVCAMYRREIFDKLGGFTKRTIFNEDMVYAGTACQNGYAIMYVPEAGVIHSHNYTYLQQFHRNFDLGVSQIEHPEIFGNLKSETEGKKMVKETMEHFRRIGKGYLIPDYVIMCGFRFLGYKLGRNYKKLPKGLVKALASNKEYFSKWN
ncbi:glycosyltransferase family 2 protein [Butyrivibrio sp. CB08]|uniref:glycosyltransferase family 2 protein n=1 Tax=Butyrivibrio sp. CB08 TaxID=2364879 RepID=UPI000EA99DB2|nr:glycosyltransferase [Butyrivibrio sp. CB08]RKM57808.1 glycosyltransferase family 2 protein [Butyrivibrio sp. CB08]